MLLLCYFLLRFLQSTFTLYCSHLEGSSTSPFSSYCGREGWRPSAHSSSYLFWWCPACISISVFLSVSNLLPPCPALFLSYGYRLYVWHVHTSVVASALIMCAVISWTVAASLISSFLLCSLRLTPCVHRNILMSVLFISISSFFFIVQHSAPYVIVGFITVL